MRQKSRWVFSLNVNHAEADPSKDGSEIGEFSAISIIQLRMADKIREEGQMNL